MSKSPMAETDLGTPEAASKKAMPAATAALLARAADALDQATDVAEELVAGLARPGAAPAAIEALRALSERRREAVQVAVTALEAIGHRAVAWSLDGVPRTGREPGAR